MVRSSKRIAALVLIGLLSLHAAVFLMRESRKDSLSDLRQCQAENISRVKQQKTEIEDVLYDYEHYRSPFTEEDLKNLLDQEEKGRRRVLAGEIRLSRESMREDLILLFDLLREHYAAYEYFGGEEHFSLAKERLLESIEESEEAWTLLSFEEAIRSELSFVRDLHFKIGMKPMIPSQDEIFFYSNAQIEYFKDKKGFCHLENQSRRYVLEVETAEGKPMPIEALMKPSLNLKGEIIYRPGLLSPLADHYQISLKFRDEKGTYTVDLFKAAGSGSDFGKEVVLEREIEGIPILSIRSMHIQKREDVAKVAKFATRQRKMPVSVLDLRGNAGGISLLPCVWFRSYTGELPSTGRQAALLLNRSYILLSSKRKEANSVAGKSFSEMRPSLQPSPGALADMETAGIQNGWHVEAYEEKIYPNSNKIFVLVDKETASAAEWFVHDLIRIENLFLVGTNTAGAQRTGGGISFRLPRTNQQVVIPSVLYLPDTVQEGEGYHPDLWMNEKDGIERLIRFVKSRE
ncbi:MAG: S41 family peptidase [Peptostreptococcaceae bacterium]|nr:S41 family peptidase [Peptostreptococcaceae bacterium]